MRCGSTSCSSGPPTRTWPGPRRAATAHQRLGEQAWTVADEWQLERRTFGLVTQVIGKVRERVEASVGESDARLVERAMASPRVQVLVDGRQVRQTIVVPGRVVNLV